MKQDDNQIQSAMIMMAVAMLVIPGIDAIAKWMSDSIAAGQVTWSRFLFQTLFMFPLVIGLKGAPFASGVWVHVARGGMIALATLLFFMALKHLPIADAIAIFFVEPLLVTLLAAVFLKEGVGWRRLLAIAFGFIGALLVIRPNFEQFGWPAALPLGTALAFAIYILLTRRVSQREDPATMQFYAGIFGFVIMTIALLIGEHTQIDVLRVTWPNLTEFGLLILLGLIATVCHLLVVNAFQRAPVAVLAPFQYIEIISATALGLVFFGDFPDSLTWLGVAIIVSSGMFVFYRERKLSQQA
ncbi:MAG: DMT family transporter [Pseudomonadota bacterium]